MQRTMPPVSDAPYIGWMTTPDGTPEPTPGYRRFAGHCGLCGLGLQWEAYSLTRLVDSEGLTYCEPAQGPHVVN